MPPSFTLQSVLDYRHNLVEAKEMELGQLFAYQKNVEDQLEMIVNTKQQLFAAMNQSLSGDLDLVYHDQLRRQVDTVEQKKVETQALLVEIQQQVDEKRKELVSAKQDEEVLVTLKDKEIQKFVEKQSYIELKVQDDIYISQAYQTRNS